MLKQKENTTICSKGKKGKLIMSETLKDHLYLWCHNAGVYNVIDRLNDHSDMTPAQAANDMGFDNIIMVSYGGKPVPPFAPFHEEFKRFKRVVWSIIGDSACVYDNKEAYVDEILSLQKKYPNVTGGIMDDFFHGSRTNFDLDAISAKMRNAGLPLWVVVYDYEVHNEDVLRKLEECDVITFWTWDVANLASMEKNLAELREKFPRKKIVSGCYLWNFGGWTPLTVRHMEYQCNAALDLLKNGTINDMIILGSPLIGMKIPTIDWTRNWIRENFS